MATYTLTLSSRPQPPSSKSFSGGGYRLSDKTPTLCSEACPQTSSDSCHGRPIPVLPSLSGTKHTAFMKMEDLKNQLKLALEIAAHSEEKAACAERRLSECKKRVAESEEEQEEIRIAAIKMSRQLVERRDELQKDLYECQKAISELRQTRPKEEEEAMALRNLNDELRHKLSESERRLEEVGTESHTFSQGQLKLRDELSTQLERVEREISALKKRSLRQRLRHALQLTEESEKSRRADALLFEKEEEIKKCHHAIARRSDLIQRLERECRELCEQVADLVPYKVLFQYALAELEEYRPNKVKQLRNDVGRRQREARVAQGGGAVTFSPALSHLLSGFPESPTGSSPGSSIQPRTLTASSIGPVPPASTLARLDMTRSDHPPVSALAVVSQPLQSPRISPSISSMSPTGSPTSASQPNNSLPSTSPLRPPALFLLEKAGHSERVVQTCPVAVDVAPSASKGHSKAEKRFECGMERLRTEWREEEDERSARHLRAETIFGKAWKPKPTLRENSFALTGNFAPRTPKLLE